jgi:hypothetical protein
MTLNEKELKKFHKDYGNEYQKLYDGKKKPSYTQVARFDKLYDTNESFKEVVIQFARYRMDAVTSDRELNAFMNAFDKLFK